jgi:hypothetical protein
MYKKDVLINTFRFGALLIAAAAIWILDVRLKALILITLFNFTLKENFPFSNYPMYSRLSSKTYFILVTDDCDRRIPLKSRFGIAADFLKRLFKHEVEIVAADKGCPVRRLTVSDLEAPAQKTLKILLDHAGSNCPNDIRMLRLYQVNLSIQSSSVKREKVLLAELHI